jgi:hypothetical protein
VDTLSPVGFILVGFHDTRSILNLFQNGVKPLEVRDSSLVKLFYSLLDCLAALEQFWVLFEDGTFATQ